MRKILLDRQSWETVDRRFDSVRFLSAINARLLLPVDRVDEALSLDGFTLLAATRDVGFDDVNDLKESIAGSASRQVLKDIVSVDPSVILAEYDLFQLRAVLFNCSSAEIEVTEDFNAAVRLARLSGFSFDVIEIAGGYRFLLKSSAHFTGSFGFGRALSKLASSLVRLRGWSLSAKFKDHVFSGTICVNGSSGYLSAKAPPTKFDSKVEEGFWNSWHREERNGWTLHREPRLIVHGTRIFCPDFEARKEGVAVIVEIVGKNDPRYAVPKAESLAGVTLPPTVLLVKKEIASLFEELPATVITHSNHPSVEKTLLALESIHSARSVAHSQR